MTKDNNVDQPDDIDQEAPGVTEGNDSPPSVEPASKALDDAENAPPSIKSVAATEEEQNSYWYQNLRFPGPEMEAAKKTKLAEVAKSLWGDGYLNDYPLAIISQHVDLADPEKIRTTPTGFELDTGSGSTIHWSKPAADGGQETISKKSAGEFSDADAAAMVALAKLHGLQKIEVTGTQAQKEKLWLAAMRQNNFDRIQFEAHKKMGSIAKTAVFTPAVVENFEPSADSEAMKLFQANKAKTEEALAQIAAENPQAAAPGAPKVGDEVQPDSVASLGKDANTPGAWRKTKAVTKFLGGVAVPIATTVVVRMLAASVLAACFGPATAAILVPAIFLTWSATKIYDHGRELYNDVRKQQQENEAKGDSPFKAFRRALNMHKFRAGILIGSMGMLALGLSGQYTHVANAISDKVHGAVSSVRDQFNSAAGHSASTMVPVSVPVTVHDVLPSADVHNAIAPPAVVPHDALANINSNNTTTTNYNYYGTNSNAPNTIPIAVSNTNTVYVAPPDTACYVAPIQQTAYYCQPPVTEICHPCYAGGCDYSHNIQAQLQHQEYLGSRSLIRYEAGLQNPVQHVSVCAPRVEAVFPLPPLPPSPMGIISHLLGGGGGHGGAAPGFGGGGHSFAPTHGGGGFSPGRR